MKTIQYSLMLAAAACGFANAQTTAYTTPVGYVSTTVAASGDTYLSPTLVQPTDFSGVSSAAPSLKTITFSGSVPTTLGRTSVLEITSGASAGWWSTIVSSTATTIEVSDTFPSNIGSAVSVSVRKHNTLKSFLGSNSPGLIPFDGESANDEVQVLNPATQVVTTCAYVPNAVSGLPDGWFDLGLSASADDYIIEPGTAVKIKRVGTTSATFAFTGTVKLTATQVDVYPDFNWVGTHSAAGATLDTMNFASQLIPFDGVSTNSDELQFLSDSQTVTPYASLDASFGLGVVMGNLALSEPAGTILFPSGFGAVLKRASSTASSVITIPGTAVSN